MAMDIFGKKKSILGTKVFDNAPSHVKKANNALNADKMNVSDGGKQLYMRTTVWRGKVQKNGP